MIGSVITQLYNRRIAILNRVPDPRYIRDRADISWYVQITERRGVPEVWAVYRIS